jgi:UDP-glucose 4-epimerase
VDKALVLGGAGYIGSHTVYELIDGGFEVTIVDNLETGHRAAVHPQAKFYEGDIRDGDFLDKVFKKERPEVIIHFAANSQVGESMIDPLKYYDNNVGGTICLLKAMVRHSVKHIVFSSSAAVYGEPEEMPIPETAPTCPTNCYGETKLAMERMFYWAEKAHGLGYVSLRYFNACGAHESANIGEAHNPETHLIPIVLQVPNEKREFVSVFGEDYDTPDGSCLRDYIHVSDLARAHVLAARHLINGGKSDIFNLGNGEGFSVKEIISESEKVVGKAIPYKIAPRRPGDPARLVASSKRAKNLLGWQPKQANIEEIIASAWRWHKEHPYGYGK